MAGIEEGMNAAIALTISAAIALTIHCTTSVNYFVGLAGARVKAFYQVPTKQLAPPTTPQRTKFGARYLMEYPIGSAS